MRPTAILVLSFLHARAFRAPPRRPGALSRAPRPSSLALSAEPADANNSVAAAAKNLGLWSVLLLVEPALRVPNYSECVATKGHAACADLLPLLDWLYNHGVQLI
mmetsp:Transcript_19774/g.58858  ORF Transcript_19774/g.58858 Transcript_19774/m.58858 type:complete len:105 (-) Transcript_19774:155-469(-)